MEQLILNLFCSPVTPAEACYSASQAFVVQYGYREQIRTMERRATVMAENRVLTRVNKNYLSAITATGIALTGATSSYTWKNIGPFPAISLSASTSPKIYLIIYLPE